MYKILKCVKSVLLGFSKKDTLENLPRDQTGWRLGLGMKVEINK